MKKLIFLATITICFCSCRVAEPVSMEDINGSIIETRATDGKTEHYYWCDGVKIPLTVNNDKMFVILETSRFENVVNRNNLTDVKSVDNHKVLGVRSLKSSKMVDQTSFTLNDVSQQKFNLDDALYVSPYYNTDDGSEIGITNILSVQLTRKKDIVKLQEIADKYNLEILGENRYDPSIYYLSCSKESRGNALEIANDIYESGEFEYATPEFILEAMTTSAPNDYYYINQWNLNNISYSGIDINYEAAFTNFTFPYMDSVIVAVIDDGVITNHPDLSLHSECFDAHTGDTTIAGVYGSHGTRVAGVIGAIANNQIGVAGVASGVKIMPISLRFEDDGSNTASTSVQFANAIRYAASHNARIINNSWALKGSYPISEIHNAITFAHNKGSIVVFGSGNDTSMVSQPAAGAPDATIVVGAIKKNGHKETYSNYGSALDVVAPGANIWTTDSNGQYVCVSGTSVSAPHVSAIAALIWARNIQLPAWKVRDIIEQSGKKVGSNQYLNISTRTNGSWNQYYGYGLVDAYTAVSAAVEQNSSTPLIYTELMEITVSDVISMELDDADAWERIYFARAPGNVTAYIENYDSATTYEWTSTLSPYTGYGSTFTVQYPSGTDEPELHDITCRAIKNGQSSTNGISIVVVPFNYSY